MARLHVRDSEEGESEENASEERPQPRGRKDKKIRSLKAKKAPISTAKILCFTGFTFSKSDVSQSPNPPNHSLDHVASPDGLSQGTAAESIGGACRDFEDREAVIDVGKSLECTSLKELPATGFREAPLSHRVERSQYHYNRSVQKIDSSDESTASLADFVVSDSASEADAIVRPKPCRRSPTKSPRKLISRKERDKVLLSKSKGPADKFQACRAITEVVDLISSSRDSTKKAASTVQVEDAVQSEDICMKDLSSLAIPSLKEKPSSSHLRVPFPSVSLLPSTPFRITTKPPARLAHGLQPPYHPSMDLFWNQETINYWKDQYSPLRTPTSRRPLELSVPDLPDEDGYSFPNFNPAGRTQGRTHDLSSPKKDTASIQAAQKFKMEKEALAVNFIRELDEKISNGKVGSETDTTGGIKLVWSKRLLTTAGRASWKRVASPESNAASVSILPSSTCSPSTDASPNASSSFALEAPISPMIIGLAQVHPAQRPIPAKLEYKHHATIELSTKIITSPDRLYNTLAHEFCHLANFIISNQKNSPHGPSFQAWGRLASAAFGQEPYGVKVTTKHDYKIEFKYAWECDICLRLYERHSRSVKVDKVKCGGGCGGELKQVRPLPRGVAGGGLTSSSYQGINIPRRKPSLEFRDFVKRHFQRAKEDLEGKTCQGTKVSMKEVMTILGREWKERSGRKEADNSQPWNHSNMGDHIALGQSAGSVTGKGSMGGSVASVKPQSIVTAMKVLVLSDDD
ncbi:hypothetical protein MMC25_005842 [Agyrium rufum]|nr:hypothetical protein [Agyrium rufum]